MNIVFFMNYARRGGAEIYIYTLMNELKKKGIVSSIISGSETKVIEGSWKNYKINMLWIDQGLLERLPFFKRVIWVFRYFFFFFDFLARLKVLSKADYFVCQQPWPSSFALFCAKLLRKKVYILVHHIIDTEYSPLIQHQLDDSINFIAVTNEVKNHLVSKLSRSNIAVLPNPIESFDPGYRLKKTKRQKTKTITMISHVYDKKSASVVNFCKVSKRFPDFSFQIIGECSSGFSKELIKKYGQSINFRGLMGRNDLYRSILESDVVVGVGRSAIESVMLGKTVVIAGHIVGRNGGNFGGVVNSENFQEISEYNYSGRHSNELITEELLAESIRCGVENIGPIIKPELYRVHSPKLVCQNFLEILGGRK